MHINQIESGCENWEKMKSFHSFTAKKIKEKDLIKKNKSKINSGENKEWMTNKTEDSKLDLNYDLAAENDFMLITFKKKKNRIKFSMIELHFFFFRGGGIQT